MPPLTHCLLTPSPVYRSVRLAPSVGLRKPKAEVIALYAGGMSMEAIQRKAGYDSMRVRRVLDDAGVEIRRNHSALSREVMAEIVEP